MKKKVIVLCILLCTLVLEILPLGAVCNFGNPEGEPFRETYSYFSLIPYGYANFAPLITAVLTCVLLLIIIIAVIFLWWLIHNCLITLYRVLQWFSIDFSLWHYSFDFFISVLD